MANRSFGKRTAPKAETPVETKGEREPIVDNAPETDNDIDNDITEEPETTPETPEEKLIEGDQLSKAIRLAAKETPLMSSVQNTLAKGREDWQGGPIMTLFSLQQAYTDEELDSFPIPGSKAPNNNPDNFKEEYMDGDKRKTRATTFYVQFARNTPSGKNYLQRIEWLKRVADKGAIKDGIPEDIVEMTPEQRRVHATFCNGRIRTAAQSYRNAMRLHFKIKEVEEYGDGQTVQVNPLWIEGHGPDEVDPADVQLEPGNEPLHVSYAVEGKPIQWDMYSITAFLKLNPKAAAEKGGGWVQLRDSGATKRAPQAPGTAEKITGAELTIQTPDRAVGFLTETHRWMEEVLSEKDRATYGKLAQMLTGKDTDESTVAIVELKNWLADMCRDLKLDARYVKIKTAGSDLISDVKVPTKTAA